MSFTIINNMFGSAAQTGDVQFLQQFEKKELLIQPGGMTLSWIAAEAGQLPVLQYLKSHGINLTIPNESGRSSTLAVAVYRGHLEICQFILENSNNNLSDKDSNGQTVIDLAMTALKESLLQLNNKRPNETVCDFEKPSRYIKIIKLLQNWNSTGPP